VLIPVDALRQWLLDQAQVRSGRVDATVDEFLASVNRE
jgi:hypothetical protein